MKSKSFIARSVAVAAILLMAISVPASGAQGSFPWTANYKYGLYSRYWTSPIAGDTKIYANSSTVGCAQAGVSSYWIQLYRHWETGDTAVGSKVYYSCGSTKSYTWKNLPAGTYRFRIGKTDNGKYLYTSGTVYYPSS